MIDDHGKPPLETKEKYWKILWQNVKLSARYGAGGARFRKDRTEDHHKNDISIDHLKELWDKQDGKCYWLGIQMSLEDLEISNSPFAVSVERLDNDKGYVVGNVALASRFANRGRGAYNKDDFKSRLDQLLKERNVIL